MPATMFTRTLLDDDGYPVWVTSLASQDLGVRLSVVSGLDPVAVLLNAGALPAEVQSVQVSADAPADKWSSRAMEAVGAENVESSALLSAAVGEWTFLLEAGDAVLDTSALDFLSGGGLRAAHCSVNIELDTDLVYIEKGEQQFWVNEPISVYQLDELPDGLRPAAAAAGIQWPVRGGADEKHDWDPAENFRVVCALANLGLTLDDLRTIPLVGASLG